MGEQENKHLFETVANNKSMDQSKQIQVVSCTVSDLFEAKNNCIPNTTIKGILSIPEYQRPYVWKKKQLSKLVSDFNQYFNSYQNEKPLYYLGSIILHRQNDVLNIIDGQQRITTLALLDYFKNKKNQAMEYSSPVSLKHIKENYTYLSNKEIILNKLDLSLLNITLVITSREDDAYTFFETQNTGGKRLSGADIVKAHHLRAIVGNKVVANKAQLWESKKTQSINAVIGLLSKARYWNCLNWKPYPSFRHKRAIKNVVIENFTEKTVNVDSPISFYQTEVKGEDYQVTSQKSSHLKALRQPLYNGSHFIDYLSEYIDVYETLFSSKRDYHIDERFYSFRETLINGKNGTVFLKELFELVLLVYVSKFGFNNIYEFSLWAFRSVFSIRVMNRRTVREDSIEKFVREQLIIDKIFGSFTHQEAVLQCKQYTYKFNNENCSENHVKGRYLKSLGKYFTTFSEKMNTKSFDNALKNAIYDKLK